MKRTVKLTERELKRMISESVRRVLKESYNGNDEGPIELSTSVTKNDPNFGEVQPIDLWFRNNIIIVRWANENTTGEEATSNLLEEEPSMIWEILKGI